MSRGGRGLRDLETRRSGGGRCGRSGGDGGCGWRSSRLLLAASVVLPLRRLLGLRARLVSGGGGGGGRPGGDGGCGWASCSSRCAGTRPTIGPRRGSAASSSTMVWGPPIGVRSGWGRRRVPPGAFGTIPASIRPLMARISGLRFLVIFRHVVPSKSKQTIL